jgi:IS30 family transposase
MNKKHLSLDDRYTIEEGLNEGKSFKKIALLIDKDCTSISKEIRKNRYLCKPTHFNNNSNLCKIKKDCIRRNLCNSYCNNLCKHCSKCNSICPDFIPDTCDLLNNPPYVCNGCNTRRYCRKIKYIYKGKEANDNYLKTLSNSRKGINITEEQLQDIKKIVIPAIKQGHSPSIIIMNNSNIGRSESSIYRDIENGLYDNINNSDLPRKVKFRKRMSNVEKEPRNTKNRENRTYNDYLNYKSNNPYCRIVQFDTVEGKKGGKCLFTIHFPSISYMIAFLIDSQKASIIVSKMDVIKNTWKDRFYVDFEVGLTDNGKEFQMPNEMEYYDDNHKMHLFYCDPGKSYQKAEIENNHTFIRRILPKETSFDSLTQKDIDLMMDHINSTPREELNGHTPYELACVLIGENIISSFSNPIDRNKVILKPSLLKKK